jgi:hypothetical protein
MVLTAACFASSFPSKRFDMVPLYQDPPPPEPEPDFDVPSGGAAFPRYTATAPLPGLAGTRLTMTELERGIISES